MAVSGSAWAAARAFAGRPAPWAVLLFAVAGVSGVVWLYNVLAACDSLFFTHARAVLPLPASWASVLDWMSLDTSTVTTALLVATLLFPAVAVWRLRGGARPSVGEYWPYPRRLETHWLLLGVAGTLFGMLVAGVRAISQGPGQGMLQRILEGFTTSIVSTLASMAYAYWLAPVLAAGCWRLAGGRPPQLMPAGWQADGQALPRPSGSRIGFLMCVLEDLRQLIVLARDLMSTLAAEHLKRRSVVQSHLEKIAKCLEESQSRVDTLAGEVKELKSVLSEMARQLGAIAGSLDRESARRERIERQMGAALCGDGGRHAGP